MQSPLNNITKDHFKTAVHKPIKRMFCLYSIKWASLLCHRQSHYQINQISTEKASSSVLQLKYWKIHLACQKLSIKSVKKALTKSIVFVQCIDNVF